MRSSVRFSVGLSAEGRRSPAPCAQGGAGMPASAPATGCESFRLGCCGRSRPSARRSWLPITHEVYSAKGEGPVFPARPWTPRQRSSRGMFRSSQNLVVSLSSHDAGHQDHRTVSGAAGVVVPRNGPQPVEERPAPQGQALAHYAEACARHGG